MRWLPNLLTLANLVSGCVIIAAVMQGQAGKACVAMLACLVFDFLDGLVARALDAYHPLGAQLDSLADMVSFGAASGIVVYHLLLQYQSSELLAGLAFLFPVCAAIRLARFNVDAPEQDYFTGLPSPGAALLIYGLYFIWAFGDEGLVSELALSVPVILGATLIAAVLMISRIRHFSLKVKSVGWQGNEVRWVFLVLSTAVLFLMRQSALSVIIILYILLSLITHSFTRKSP